MKALLLLFSFLLTSVQSNVLYSEVVCDPHEIKDENISKLVKVSDDMKLAELKALAIEHKHNAVKYFLEPTQKSCSTVTYKIPEYKMNPGEALYFHIPPEYRERAVRFMVLGHRQENIPGWKPGTWDEKPGLSSVQVATKGNLRYWKGMSSGNKGAKFAEIRTSLEMENLYDWNSFGHVDTRTNHESTDPLYPEAMVVESVGKDQVLVGEMTLKIEPFKETTKEEKIFSEGTKFMPEGKEKKYALGGGQAFKGKFPGAKELGPGQELVIELVEGKKITSVDIACGDSHPDEVKNHDGGWGTSGWAKLSVGILKPDGTTVWMMNRENVPPEGMLIASPADCDEKNMKGSKLIIKSESDTTYIMGVHIGYR